MSPAFIRGYLALSTLMVVAGALTACSDSVSKSSAAADRCVDEAISAHNDVLHKARLFNSNRNQENLEEAKKSCSQFKALMGGKACRAENATTGAAVTIQETSLDDICLRPEEILSPRPNETSPEETTPDLQPVSTETTESDNKVETPSGEGQQIVGQLTNGIEITVKDEAIFNELMKSDYSSFLQDGKVSQKIDSSKDLCYVLRRNADIAVKSGDVLHLVWISSAGLSMAAASKDTKMSISCVKYSSDSEWTVQELRNVFKDTADIQAASGTPTEAAMEATPK